MERHITVPVAKEEIQDLRAGDYVYLTGVIYTPVMLLIKEWMKCFQKEKSFHLILRIR